MNRLDWVISVGLWLLLIVSLTFVLPLVAAIFHLWAWAVLDYTLLPLTMGPDRTAAFIVSALIGVGLFALWAVAVSAWCEAREERLHKVKAKFNG